MTIMSIMIIRVVVVVGVVGAAIWFQARGDRGKVKSNSWHNGLGFTSGVALTSRPENRALPVRVSERHGGHGTERQWGNFLANPRDKYKQELES